VTTAIMKVIALGPTYGPLSRTLLPMSERVQLRRARGWRKPEHTIIVSRPSRWGNPYPVRVYGRNQALRLYAEHLRQHPHVCSAIREELAGRNLACWCRLDEPCHADLLLCVARGIPLDALLDKPGEDEV